LSIDKIAEQVVTEAREKKQRILGFGHRVHTADPRTTRLFQIADDENISGEHILLAKAIEKTLHHMTGKHLPINVDGAIAAIISDMGFDWRLGKGFFLLGRVAGLTAHAHEEQTAFKPMRKMFTIEYEYDGPEDRTIK
jgi:citrate synthase